MKIAHIAVYYKPTIGGVTKVIEELAKRQVAAGYEVHVYCSDWDKEKRIKKKEEIIDGVHVHRIKHWCRVSNFEVLFPGLFSKLFIKAVEFDVIHSHVFGHLHFFLASLVAKHNGTRHIHTTHCPWTDANRGFVGKVGVAVSYNIFSRLGFKLTDKIIAITPWEIKYIKKYGGNEKKIIVIPNGMGKEFFKKIEDNDFKERHNIKGKMVLFFGRLNVTKSPDNFVKIAKLILKERNDTTFVILGPDEGMRDKVKELIGDEKRILLLPETRDKTEVLKMYQSADIYVLPSFREGLPLTLFEAMASGLPIIATPVNGIPYEMKDGLNGFLVKHGDNEYFANRIQRLLDDNILRKRISKTNIKKAKDYDWDLIFKRTMEVYKEK